MIDITKKLSRAKILIHNMLGSGQSDINHAVRYAMRQTELPADLGPQLEQYANVLIHGEEV